VALSGYSLGGILEDCNIPLSAYPLESLQRSLKEISEKLLAIFNLRLVIAPNVSQQANAIYKKTVAEPSESIASYISKLASQRNIVLGHNENGDLVFFRPNANAAPKFFFTQNNTRNMGWSINGQGLHSSVEVLRQPSDDNEGVSLADSALNPLVRLKRPSVSVLSSGTETDTKFAADNKMASELANMVLSVEVEK
jgi:prophage tail gpP-like protein